MASTGLVGLAVARVAADDAVLAQAAPNGREPVELGPEWWRANKRRAVFVPGKGYTVEGVPGFFDENGVPIRATNGPTSFGVGYDGPIAIAATPAERPEKMSILDRFKAAVGRGRDEKKARELVNEAEALYRARDFAAAAAKYRAAAARCHGLPLEEDALFMMAESEFFADAYPRASDAYAKLLKEFPGSRHLDNVIARQFEIAKYWQEYDTVRPHWPLTPNLLDKTRRRFDTFGHALKVYENIRLADPTGPRADDALMAAATAHFTHGRYADADYHFDLLRREYPKSEFQFEAHLLGLQCKLRKYQGPEYDGKPLADAEQLTRQLLTQFPDKVDGERQRIEKMRAEVAAQVALRDWTMAEYYTKGRYYGAARHYYRRLVENHARTKLAEKAQVQLAKLEGRPDTPSPPVAWLANLFTENQTNAQAAAVPPGDTRRR